MYRYKWAVCLGLVCAIINSAAPCRGDQDNDSEPRLSPSVEASLSYLLSVGSHQSEVQPLDFSAMMPVVDYVRQAPQMATYTPGARKSSRGSCIAFSISRSLQDLIRYTYNKEIPIGTINPSSVNHGYWKEVSGRGKDLPDLWETLNSLSSPQVIQGVLHESITPDLHSGAYYDYDLQRTILAFQQGSLRVVISISDQVGTSEIGRKGFIVGPDQDWNYLYTQEQGLNKAGLGWVKSKIYKFFSVGCYIQDDARPNQVKIGTFQWLNAGWAGFNMVNSDHIRRGMLRYASQIKGLMESAKMPAPQTLENLFLALQEKDDALLKGRVAEVTRYIRRKAEQDELITNKALIRQIKDEAYADQMSKAELIGALMKEFIKLSLGKETPLNRSFWAALKPRGKSQPPPPAL